MRYFSGKNTNCDITVQDKLVFADVLSCNAAGMCMQCFLIVRVDRPPISGGSNGACYICVASLNLITYLACTERDLNNEEKYNEICLKLDLGKVKQS
jgi:hypothetical protein